MNMPLVVLMSAQAVVFLAFIVLAFRWLFAVRRDAVERSGKTLPGLGATLAAFRRGFEDPDYSETRWGIAGCMIFLLIAALLGPVLMSV